VLYLHIGLFKYWKFEKTFVLNLKLKILYGIYVIECDIIDDSNVALMVDVSNIFGDILPILYDYLLQFLHIFTLWMWYHQSWYDDAME